MAVRLRLRSIARLDRSFVTGRIWGVVLLTAFLCGSAQAQAPNAETKQPGISVETNRGITNIQVVDLDLSKQAQVFAAILKVPSDQNPTIIPWLTANAVNLQPAFQYELARRLWDAGRQDDALEWFAVAWIRSKYDAMRCVDTSAGQGILMLPGFAANVQSNFESNRSAFGAAGLRALSRPDLFTSTVSPWWICSHGIKAVAAVMEKRALQQSDWLKPEAESAAIQTALRQQLTTYFEEQSKPQDDPIPMTKTPYKVTEVVKLAAGRLDSYAWLDESRLAFGESLSQLVVRVWRHGAPSEEVARFLGQWCAGAGVITYFDRRVDSPPGASPTFYSGPPGAAEATTLSFRSMIRGAQITRGFSTNWPTTNDPKRQSPFDCRWVESERLSGADNNADWVPLLPGHGAILFEGKLGGISTKLLHFLNDQATPTELPIKNVTSNTLRYIPFRKAYFLSPHVAPPREGEKLPACIPMWWFEPETMRTEETCAPTDRLNENFVTYAPTRLGLLRTALQRRTAHGNKPGGLYLTLPDGRNEKIFEASVMDSSVSADGCAVAVRAITVEVESVLSVIDLCGDRPIASPN